MKPRLSIVITSYNYGCYLPEALDSVLTQNYDDYEVILIDDCSTDDSPSISEKYARLYPQIHYIRHAKNVGLFESLRRGFRASQGEYLHFFSADDKYLPGFLPQCMGFLEQNPQAGVMCSDIGYFQDGSDKLDERKILSTYEQPVFFPSQSIVSIFQTTPFWVTGTSCIAKRNLLEKYGLPIPALENLSDWFLFHTIALKEGIGYIPKTFITMRTHEHSLTNQVKRNKKRRRTVFRHLLNHLLKDPSLRKLYVKAGLLDFIFRDLKWKLYLNPKYISYWKH